MLQAFIRGKLSRDQENLEDMLTSCVFGGLEYLGDWTLMASWLAQARTLDGARPLADLGVPTAVEFDFWPGLQGDGLRFCEPDVVIRWPLPGERKLHLLVEAKFRSGKSSFAEGGDGPRTLQPANDQLAKEWENLLVVAGDAPAWVLYLTADLIMPRAEIREAQDELVSKGKRPGNIAWLSWAWLSAKLKGERHLVQDLARVLERLGLQSAEYTGFSSIATPTGLTLAFDAGLPRRPSLFQGFQTIAQSPMGRLPELGWSRVQEAPSSDFTGFADLATRATLVFPPNPLPNRRSNG